MLEYQERKQTQSSVTPSDRGDTTHADTAKKAVDIVPATIKIDLEIDPVAYHYESWSEMADGWIESVRSSGATMLDPDHDQIRNVTPLVPLSDVEALVEQMILSREVALGPKRTDSLVGSSPP